MRRLGLVVALVLTIAPPLAKADYDPLAAGTTRIVLDKGFLTLLKQNGVQLSAVAPARLAAGVVTFPIAAGKFDPVSGKGTIEHEGALLFQAGTRRIPLKALQLKTASKHAPFSVKAGGGQLKLAAARSLAVSRLGFGDRVSVSALTLSAKIATRLGKKLQLRGVFGAGQPLASSVTTVQPETISVLGKGRAELTLDPGILAKLRDLFVAVNPIFPAEHVGSAFQLPIFGGTIAPDASSGVLQTSGALELLQLGGGQVFWHEPWAELAAGALSAEADAEPAPPYPGKLGRGSIAGLSLAGATISASAQVRSISVGGASLALSPVAAATFNEVFAKPQGKEGIFIAGEALGTVSFTALGR
ncbi:MAG TPA: hypothetical protein VHU86_11175 [Solirubrobacterales bacterium]|jgi:hypothetical protein|nr:hypothetical protein [Solirubrobacterales bacterium]